MRIENCYIALLHYPVYNKNGDVVTAAVTNMDIHDISRLARTYGVRKFYIVTPIEQQQLLVRRILVHWQNGYGVTYNPSRNEAFKLVELKRSLDEVIGDVADTVEGKVCVVATSAVERGESMMTSGEIRKSIGAQDACLLIFGTGWGITDEVIQQSDFLMEPIRGASDYNHLSVRSAVAISLDRLLERS